MKSLAPRIKLFVCMQAVDMRKSFDGLAVATRQLIGGDPLDGNVFVFFNRNADICKILWWSTGGFFLFAKRLSRGRFKLPSPKEGANHVELSAIEVSLILDGIDIRQTRKRTRWKPRTTREGALGLAS